MKTDAGITLTGRLVRNLDIIRSERGMSGERLCKVTGISRNTLHLWRRGECEARLKVVERAADALGFPDAADLLQLDASAILANERGVSRGRTNEGTP